MPVDNYPIAEFHPHTLSKEEIENPPSVIDSFFECAHLPQIRQMLWEYLQVAIAGTWCRQTSDDRADMLYFYEKLEKLIEAAHIIRHQSKTV